MSQIASVQIPKPSDEQAFERACRVLYKCILGDPHVKTHGRRGQKQNGVDISGQRDRNPEIVVGIQCKLKGEGKTLDEEEIRAEVVKARKFKPQLSEFIIVTTAPDDTSHDELALTLSQEESKGRSKPLRVSILGWNSLEYDIQEHVEAHKAFDPSHTPFGEHALNEISSQIKEFVQRTDDKPAMRMPADSVSGIANLGGGESATLNKHLDEQITQYAELMKTQPSTALSLLEQLQSKFEQNVSARLRYRAAANIAASHLELGSEETASAQLISSYEIDPSHPKAAANKCLGLLVAKKPLEAIDFGFKHLEDQPDNGTLACFIIQARIQDEGVSDPLEGIPENLFENPEVLLAVTKFTLDRGDAGQWWDIAIKAHEQYPDIPEIELNYALALLEMTIKDTQFQYGHVLTHAQRESLETVVEILTARWDIIKDPKRHFRGDKLSVPLNLVTAYRLLQMPAEAREVCEKAYALFPDEIEVIERYSAVLGEQGYHEEAVAIISEIPISTTTFMVRFTAAMQYGEWSRVIDLGDKHFEKCPEIEKPLVEVGVLIAKLSSEEVSNIDDHLTDAFETYANYPRCLIALSQFCRVRNKTSRSLEFYNKSREVLLGNPDYGMAAKLMFANEAMNQQKFTDAINALYGYVDETSVSDELILLSEAFANEYPTRKRSLSFFETLPDSISTLPKFEVMNAICLLNAGQNDDAVAILRISFEREQQLHTLIYLLLGLMRVGDEKAVSDYLERLEYDDLSGQAEHKIKYAQLLLHFGHTHRALRIGYDAVCFGHRSPSVVMKFCGLILNPKNNREFKNNGRVSAGQWIRLHSDQDDIYERLVGEEVDRPWGSSVRSDDDFLSHALNLKVGDTFVSETALGTSKTWTVLEVKPKWLQAFHSLSATYSERFPNSNGIAQMKMKDDDLEPAFEQIRRHSEAQRSLVEMYTRDGVPAALVARNGIGGAVGFADYLAFNENGLFTCQGNHSERVAALETVREHKRTGAILDILTAWRVAELKMFPALSEVLGTIRISNVDLNVIRALIEHESLDYGGDSLSLSYQDGQYYRQVITEAERQKSLQLHKARLAEIEKHCEEVPFVLGDSLSEESEAIVSFGLSEELAAPLLCRENEILISDDFHMRRYCHALGVSKSVWLQPVLGIALEWGVISRLEYAEALSLLASHKHSYISVSSDDLLSILYSDDNLSDARFDALSQYVGAADAEFMSHARLIADFMNSAWTSTSSFDVSLMEKSSKLLRNFLFYNRRPNWSYWAAGVWTLLGHWPRNFFEGWLRGHFLPLEEVKQVAQETINEAKKQHRKRVGPK